MPIKFYIENYFTNVNTGMKNFKDKKVIITGAGSGMGRNLAYQLSALGAEVYITDIKPDELKETTDHILAKGGKCKSYLVDCGKENEISAFAEN